MKKKLVLLVLAAVLVFGWQAYAAEIPVLNNSFEDPVTSDGQRQPYGNIPNWVTDGNTNSMNYILNPQPGWFAGPVPDGENVLHLYLAYSTTWTQQDLTATIKDGYTYTLTGYLSNYLYTLGTNYTAGGTLQLLTQNDKLLAEDISAPSSDGKFKPLTATYDANAVDDGQFLRIRLVYWAPEGLYGSAIWDDIRLTETSTGVVPLPGALLLLGTGLGSLAIYRRRKMTAKN